MKLPPNGGAFFSRDYDIPEPDLRGRVGAAGLLYYLEVDLVAELLIDRNTKGSV